MIRRALSLAVNTARLHRDPVRYFRSQGVEIGEDVEIFGANLFTFGSEPYLVSIGNQVTISHNVDFITHDGGMRVARHKYPGCLSLRTNPGCRPLLSRCALCPSTRRENRRRVCHRQWFDRHGRDPSWRRSDWRTC